jgi:hypothetical protein
LTSNLRPYSTSIPIQQQQPSSPLMMLMVLMMFDIRLPSGGAKERHIV